MELSWLTKLRIVAALALGGIGLGLGAWSVVAPADPMGVVSVANVTVREALYLLAFSFLSGLGGYFVAWPYGRQIGVLTVPAGLAVWAIRSDEIYRIMQDAPSGLQRARIYALFPWDSLLWLALIGAGLTGLWVASRVRPTSAAAFRDPLYDSRPKGRLPLDAAAAVLISLVIGYALVGVLAQGTQLTGAGIATQPTQPGAAQIVFAVMIAFGVAGFVTGRVLRLGPSWPTAASAGLPVFVGLFYARPNLLEPLARNYPATCFLNPVMAILPIQMVAFGALGAAAGYWTAVRYEYWRKHQPA